MKKLLIACVVFTIIGILFYSVGLDRFGHVAAFMANIFFVLIIIRFLLRIFNHDQIAEDLEREKEEKEDRAK